MAVQGKVDKECESKFKTGYPQKSKPHQPTQLWFRSVMGMWYLHTALVEAFRDLRVSRRSFYSARATKTQPENT